MTFLPPSSPKNFDRCGCGAVLSEDVYRTELSCSDAADYGCQRCQDLRFVGASGSRPDVDLRHGVLVARTVHVGPSRGEICLLPFLATACGSRIAWETHRIVRIGSALIHVDPWSEVAPLEDSLEGHRIHIDRVSSTRAPLVRERLGIADLVVGVDETSRDVIARLPVPDDADVESSPQISRGQLSTAGNSLHLRRGATPVGASRAPCASQRSWVSFSIWAPRPRAFARSST